ncbi:DUF1127 domain-containing protein [Duffyella gerundensis]
MGLCSVVTLGKVIVNGIRSRILRYQTRRILSRLTDSALKDIGVTRDDLRKY